VGTVEILDSKLEAALILTNADKMFIEEIARSVVSTYDSEDFEFSGSDDDIRKRFEKYLLSMLVSCKAMQQVSRRLSVAGFETQGKDINLYSDFKYLIAL
jgi:hypothetical protein